MRTVALLSLLSCLLFVGLSQLPNVSIIGINSEPSRILFYGSTGLLATIAGLISIGSALYLGASKVKPPSVKAKKIYLVIALSVSMLIIYVLIQRLIL